MPQTATATTRTPLGSIPAADKRATVRRVLAADKPAPLEVAAFSSSI